MATHDKNVLTSWLGLAALTALAGLAVLLNGPPAPRAADVPADEFSAERAASHVERLTRAPRTLGSPAHQDARSYIADTLRSMGLEPEIQETTSVQQRGNTLVAARVANVVVRVPGRGLPGGRSGKAILWLAHYDTRPSTPGAGDDAAGVAALLEGLRAVLAGPPLENDLIAVFTDGEELGLLGARAFAAEDPAVADVGVVLNVEGRGNRGPSLMFETGAGNRRLIEEMRRAVPHPRSTSLTVEVYRRMPNDSDFSAFRDRGLRGYNLAFIGGLDTYHHARDTAARLDRGSLQHHGSYLLALTRHLGDLDLGTLATNDDAVYFNVLGDLLVAYPASWAGPLACVAAVLLLLVLLLGKRRKAVGRGAALAAGLFLGAVAAAAALAWGLWWTLSHLVPRLTLGPYGVPYHTGLWTLALALAVGGVVTGVLRLGHRRIRPAEAAAGVLVVGSALALATAFLVTGASHLYLWPTLFATVALAYAVQRPGEDGFAPRHLVVWSVAVIPAVLLLAPLTELLFQALTVRAAGILAIPVALAAGFLAPLAIHGGRRMPAALLIAGVLVLAVALVRSGFDAEHPRTDFLLYTLDADTGDALWVSFDKKSSEWTGQVLDSGTVHAPLPAYLSTSGTKVLQRKAPALDVMPPDLLVLSDSLEDDGRHVALEVWSQREATILRLRADPGAGIRAATVDGQRFELGDDSGDPFYLVAHGVTDLMSVNLEIAGAADKGLTLHLIDQSYDLPATSPGPRPSSIIPDPSWWNDSTFVHRSFVLEPVAVNLDPSTADGRNQRFLPKESPPPASP